jgi:hypothetical protein
MNEPEGNLHRMVLNLKINALSLSEKNQSYYD